MPAAALTTDSLALANRLRPVLLKLNRELRREAHGIGVTGGQVALLFAIKQSPGIGVRELAQQERMSAPALSGYVDRLEKAGFVARTPSPTDRRRVGLSLTAGGLRVLRSVKARRTAWLAARLRGLSQDELAAVDRAIEPLYELISE
jgi:DNA-binding MarR family transcriptional regulator